MSKIDEIIKGMQNANLPSDYWTTSRIEFPELEASRLIIQRGNQSLYEHTMQVIDSLAVKNPITLLSGLFHDLGKAYNLSKDNSSVQELNLIAKLLRFPNHAVKSTNIAKIRLIEWGTSQYLIDRVICIVLAHMYDIVSATNRKSNMIEGTIRRFVAKIGQDNVENWFTVRRADSASYSKHGQYQKHIIDPFYKIVKEYLDKLPQKENPLIPSPESNISVGGKDRKDGNASLLTEGR